MSIILLCLLTGAFFVNLVRKYILGIKDPDVKDYWQELDKEEWYKTLLKNDKIKDFIMISKVNGLLNDPYYVRNILDKEGHREGFIKYITEKTK